MSTATEQTSGVIVKSDRNGRTRYTTQYKGEVLAAYESGSLSAPALARQGPAFVIAEVSAACDGAALEVRLPGKCPAPWNVHAIYQTTDSQWTTPARWGKYHQLGGESPLPWMAPRPWRSRGGVPGVHDSPFSLSSRAVPPFLSARHDRLPPQADGRQPRRDRDPHLPRVQ